MPEPPSKVFVTSFGLRHMTPGGTSRVTHTLPPITEPRPIVIRPRNRRSGVDHDIVLDDRMACVSLDELAMLIDCKAFRPQRHAVIQPHTLPDHGRLADHHAVPWSMKKLP